MSTVGLADKSKRKHLHSKVNDCPWQNAFEASTRVQVQVFLSEPEELVPNADDDEEIPLTKENYKVLWVPVDYKIVHEKVCAHFLRGEGESRDIRFRLEKGTTDTGNLQVQLLESHFLYIKHELKSWKPRFLHMLALTSVIAGDTTWINDNENPEQVSKLLKDIAKYWRTALLKKDDATLGITNSNKCPCESTEEGISPSRQALFRLLQIFAAELEKLSDDICKIKFNWKPGKAHNPKGINGRNKKRKTEDE